MKFKLSKEEAAQLAKQCIDGWKRKGYPIKESNSKRGTADKMRISHAKPIFYIKKAGFLHSKRRNIRLCLFNYRFPS